MAVAVAIRGVVRTFPAPGGGTVTAVDRVTLDVAPGELFFLLGPSGCGKTTLLRMIAGFVEPTAGAILFDGRDVTGLPPEKRNTGMVFQSYALWPHMTVEGNVAFGLSVRRVRAEERARRVERALADVRMEGYGRRFPAQLSGGQQQRVALARALVVRPDVLLLDEPLSNLDARLRVELRAEVRRVCKEAGITAIYVTHDQKEALSTADRVAILDRGRVVQVGPPRELYRRPATRFAAEFLGETNLLPCSASGREGGGLVIETPAGRLVSSSPPPPPDATRLVCSIRPEALRIADGPGGVNALAGRIVSWTYLGELALLDAEVAGGVRLRVARLNPSGDPGVGPVVLRVDPEDAVVLPAD